MLFGFSAFNQTLVSECNRCHHYLQQTFERIKGKEQFVLLLYNNFVYMIFFNGLQLTCRRASFEVRK